MIPWSPLARGRLTRPPGVATNRSETDGWYADLLYRKPKAIEPSSRLLVPLPVNGASSHAQVALAWLGSKSVVTAPIVGATKAAHLADAVASLDVELTADEIGRLEAPYTPRYDFQGISDPSVLAAISKRVGIAPADE